VVAARDVSFEISQGFMPLETAPELCSSFVSFDRSDPGFEECVTSARPEYECSDNGSFGESEVAIFKMAVNCDGDGSAVGSVSGPGVKGSSKFAKSMRLISPYISRPHGPQVLGRKVLGKLGEVLAMMVREGGLRAANR
jgi:hypothetical protein